MRLKQAEGKKVLVIDSPELGRGYLRIPLDKIGFTSVDFAHSPAQADIAMEKARYDLILCSYSLATEQDGFYYFLQLKQEKRIHANTNFVLLSCETDQQLIQSIIECPPDDFIVKPFTLAGLSKKIDRLLKRQAVLGSINDYVAQNKPTEALAEIEALIKGFDHREYVPLALKIKGELLLQTKSYEKAHDFFKNVLALQGFSWAEVGLVKAYLALGFDTDAEKRIIKLASRPETKTLAYEMLTYLNIKAESYDEALESALMASNSSPKNIERKQMARLIAKLANDFEAEFNVAKQIVRMARGSVQESPEHYLNAIRAGIDFAMTCEGAQMNDIVAASKRYIIDMKQRFPYEDRLQDVNIIQARLHYLRSNNQRARELLTVKSHEFFELSMEAQIDKAKALHELGMRKESIELFEMIEVDLASRKVDDSEVLNNDSLLARFVMREKTAKKAIGLSPRELHFKGLQAYKDGNFDKAYDVFCQALSLMPRNVSIALNLLQVLVKLQLSKCMDTYSQMLHRCIDTIEQQRITYDQKQKYSKLKQALNV